VAQFWQANYAQFWIALKDWVTKRMKAIRYWIINLPGRVVRHARQPSALLRNDPVVLAVNDPPACSPGLTQS
jgi:hypothetical protein